jgi:hypothetical protein
VGLLRAEGTDGLRATRIRLGWREADRCASRNRGGRPGRAGELTALDNWGPAASARAGGGLGN